MMLLARIPSEVLFAAALGVLTFLLLRSSMRRFRRTKDDRPMMRLPRPDSSFNQGGASTPDNIARLEVQLHDQARELSAQLDSKMLALGHLTASAAQQADRLEKVIATAKQVGIKQPDANLTPSHTP